MCQTDGRSVGSLLSNHNKLSYLKSFMRNSLLTVCSLIITFVIGEICIRIIYGNPLIFVDPQVTFCSTEYGFKFKPNQHGTYTYDKPANTNSFGFRDYEWGMPKPDGRIRIMCLGDSITFGNAVNVEDSYPKILEKKLKQFHHELRGYFCCSVRLGHLRRS